MLRLLSCIRYYLIPILSILVLSNCSNNLTGIEEQNFNDLIPELKKQCYMIGVAIEGKMYGLGSGFAISNKRIMTNAHVVNSLVELAEQYGTEGYSFVAVRDGGRVNHEHSFELDSFVIHSEQDKINV